jgi:hexokinase
VLGVCSQERIDHGVLTQWTKGFGASGVEGEDAAALFRKSLKKFVSSSTSLCLFSRTVMLIPFLLQDVPVELTALINDTTGTLIASA